MQKYSLFFPNGVPECAFYWSAASLADFLYQLLGQKKLLKIGIQNMMLWT